MNLVEAAVSGDQVEILRSLRDVLAVSILDAPPDKRAPLANQLRETLSELARLTIGEEVDQVDDLSAKRVARRAAPSSAASAG